MSLGGYNGGFLVNSGVQNNLLGSIINLYNSLGGFDGIVSFIFYNFFFNCVIFFRIGIILKREQGKKIMMQWSGLENS